MPTTLSLFIDITILLALLATIFYAVRLSSSLNKFKNHRQEFETLMANLSKHIENAYTAIDALRASGDESGRELEAATKDARFLLDELKQVNEVSDSLAHRLEKLATQSRQTAAPDMEYELEEETASWQDSLPVREPEPEEEEGGFTIQDRDYSAPNVKDVDFQKREAGNNNQNFASQAEKDLYEALNKNK